MTAQEVLSDIQRKLHVPKSRHNSFGKYNYRNAEDILDAVKKVLPDAAYITVSDEMVQLGDRYYVKATARLIVNDQSIENFGWAREADSRKGMDPSQLTGATSSYARKYAMSGLFALDDGVDADSMKADAPGGMIKGTNNASNGIASYLDDAGLVKFGKFKGTKLSAVPSQELKNYIQWLTKDGKNQSPMMKQFIEDSRKQIIAGGK